MARYYYIHLIITTQASSFTELGRFYITGFPASAGYGSHEPFIYSVTLHSVLRYALKFIKSGVSTKFHHGHIIFNELMERDTRHDLATFGLGSQRSTN